MYFTNGSNRAFEMLMRGKPGFDRYESGGIPRQEVKAHKLRTIPGIPPELFDDIEGCPFAPRCEFATQRCCEVKPMLTPQRSTGGHPHLAACYYAEGGMNYA